MVLPNISIIVAVGCLLSNGAILLHNGVILFRNRVILLRYTKKPLTC
jgi:hypothetical protein